MKKEKTVKTWTFGVEKRGGRKNIHLIERVPVPL